MGDCVDVGDLLKGIEKTFAIMHKADDHSIGLGFSPLADQWSVPD